MIALIVYLYFQPVISGARVDLDKTLWQVAEANNSAPEREEEVAGDRTDEDEKELMLASVAPQLGTQAYSRRFM